MGRFFFHLAATEPNIHVTTTMDDSYLSQPDKPVPPPTTGPDGKRRVFVNAADVNPERWIGAFPATAIESDETFASVAAALKAYEETGVWTYAE
jgi:hypothetical protein